MVESRKILVVEDDRTMQPILERMIHKINPSVEVEWTATAEEALARIQQTRNRRDQSGEIAGWVTSSYAVVLSDIMLAGKKTGLDLVGECVESRIFAHFVLASGRLGLRTTLPFLPKPFKFKDVKKAISPYLITPEKSRIHTRMLASAKRALQWCDQHLDHALLAAGLAVSAWTITLTVVNLRKLPF